jgi:hypothetical protein
MHIHTRVCYSFQNLGESHHVHAKAMSAGNNIGNIFNVVFEVCQTINVNSQVRNSLMQLEKSKYIQKRVGVAVRMYP